jgi:hypothetical protein
VPLRLLDQPVEIQGAGRAEVAKIGEEVASDRVWIVDLDIPRIRRIQSGERALRASRVDDGNAGNSAVGYRPRRIIARSSASARPSSQHRSGRIGCNASAARHRLPACPCPNRAISSAASIKRPRDWQVLHQT